MSSDLLEEIALSRLRESPLRAMPQAKQECLLEYARDMTLADVEALASPLRPKLPELYSPLEDLKQRHHLLARVVASGAMDIQASAETGYSLGTIGKLKSTPAFQELVAYYRGNKEVRFLEVAERRTMVGGMVLEELQERLEEDAFRKGLTVKEMNELVKTMLGERMTPMASTQGLNGGAQGGTTLNVTFSSPAPPIGIQASDGQTTIELVANREGGEHG